MVQLSSQHLEDLTFYWKSSTSRIIELTPLYFPTQNRRQRFSIKAPNGIIIPFCCCRMDFEILDFLNLLFLRLSSFGILICQRWECSLGVLMVERKFEKKKINKSLQIGVFFIRHYRLSILLERIHWKSRQPHNKLMKMCFIILKFVTNIFSFWMYRFGSD